MKKLLYALVLAFMVLMPQGMGAKTMKDLLVSMPDEMMPYLNKNLRLEFTELQEMGVKAEVKNLLGDVSVMDTLTADFAQITMSKSSVLQMKKLPSAAGDTLVCVVKTFSMPEKESEIYLYDQDWKRMPDAVNLPALSESLIQKPDTMTEDRYHELKQMIEPMMVSADLMQQENAIVVKLALPLVSADDKKKINALRVQRKLNWNGKDFKES